MRFSVTVLIAALILSIVAISIADENRNHICFRVLDTDRDGMVTFQEFEQAYGNDKEKFNLADEDKDGKLTHDEYHDLLGHGSQK